jgi:hypothetical protein
MKPPIPQHKPTTQIGEDLFGSWEANLNTHVALVRGDSAEALQHATATEKRLTAALAGLMDLKRQLRTELNL